MVTNPQATPVHGMTRNSLHVMSVVNDFKGLHKGEHNLLLDTANKLPPFQKLPPLPCNMKLGTIAWAKPKTMLSASVDHVIQQCLASVSNIQFALCGADDVRKGYIGCFGDGDGPYGSAPWGGSHTLLASLNTDGITHEQCAQAAGQAGYEVYALQGQGVCFMGTLADVAQMERTLDDATCSTTPCVAGIDCVPSVSKVYSIGGSTFHPSPVPAMGLRKSEHGMSCIYSASRLERKSNN